MAHVWEEFFSFASADAQAMVEAGESMCKTVSKTCDSQSDLCWHSRSVYQQRVDLQDTEFC